MKRKILAVVCLSLFAAYIFLGSAAQAQARQCQREVSQNVLRLHIRANSDSDCDQTVKLKVRDAVMNTLETYRSEMVDISSSKRVIEKHKNVILKNINAVLKEYNKDYKVNINIGKEQFPQKRYGDIVLPEGEYDAVIIGLGSAEGQNWWCVLFPQLCFVDESMGYLPESSKENLKESLSGETYAAITDNEAKARFKIVEWLQNIW